MREILPAANNADEPDNKYQKLVASFCGWMAKLCDISHTFAESLNPTLNEVFNISQEGAIANLRKF